MEENNNLNQIGQENFSDDDFVIGKGFVFETEQNTETQEKPKTKKKKNKSALKVIIWILVITLLSVALAFGAIYVGADYLGVGFGRSSEKCELVIPKGTTATEIIDMLHEEGVIKVPTAFRLYAKVKGYDSKFQYGYLNFETDSGYDVICQKLMEERELADSIKVTIPEGTGINDFTKNVNGENVTVPGIATLLERAGICSKDDFINALDNVARDSELLKQINDTQTYYPLEGYLFPDTYQFFAFDSETSSARAAESAVKKLIDEAEKRITNDMFKKAEKMGYTMNEILTMASIIQMECGENFDEMPMVAGIFYNRLDNDSFPTLGSSPTCYYGNSFKQDDGRYNTYTAKGLPPGPLCSPGIEAIKAALNPEKSDYYYFVTDSSGKFYYHKTSAEQQQTINRLQQGGNWVYEYFD